MSRNKGTGFREFLLGKIIPLPITECLSSAFCYSIF